MNIMPAAVSVRDASLEDVPAILALWRAAYDEASSRSSAEDVPFLLSHGPSARLLLAEAGATLVGSLIVTFDGWRGNMYRLAVHPDRRHQGIARRLVEEAHAWLRACGCRRITALVEGDHDYATGFWESVGYEYDVAMRRYHLDIAGES